MTRFYSKLVLLCLLAPPLHATVDNACEKPCVDTETSAASADEQDSVSRWGVGDFIVRLSGAGYMLDIRYRVLDAEKAQRLFDGKFQPYIIQESTGSRFTVPSTAKVGFMRQRPKRIENNRVYFMLMANPSRTIRPGEKITLVIDDVSIEGLTVQ